MVNSVFVFVLWKGDDWCDVEFNVMLLDYFDGNKCWEYEFNGCQCIWIGFYLMVDFNLGLVVSINIKEDVIYYNLKRDFIYFFVVILNYIMYCYYKIIWSQ